ncbi:MAG TPA: tetratricopeptide repeat-containing glycosyltransferase family protein [Usitatibacter sp.]
MTAAELRARGNAALGEGKLDEAREFYRQAAAADPKDPVPWLNMGFVNIEAGRTQEAEESLARAIALAPRGADFLPDAHFLLGRVHQEQGARDRALADHMAAAAAREGFAEPMESAAQLLLDLKRYDEALDWARRSAAARENPATDLVVAQALDKLDRPDEAIVVLDALLAKDPRLSTAIEGRGVMLLRVNRANEALVAFERVLMMEGESATRLSNKAVALHRMGRFDEAVGVSQRALELDPERRDEAYNLAAVLLEMLRTDEAMEILKRVSKRYPNDADLGWNLAIGHLLRGELVEGFAAYEHRFLCDAFGWRKPAPDFSRPRWSGRESLAGKSILLFAEQGLGDSIQLLRYVPRVASMAAQVLLRLPGALVPLLKDLPPNCRWVSESEPPPMTDFQCPIMSLPNAFATTLETLPAIVPYLTADPARVQAWRVRLEALGKSPRVGIVWSGNASNPNDRNRSIPLETFRRIAAPGVQFVSLQPEVRASDRAAYNAWTGLARFGEELKDFADTAALVSALDLVVTVDTSVAHVTGALGRPVWILLPHYPDWRWLLGRDDSPWYPSMRLWRQPVPRDWPAVLDAVRGGLERVKGIEPSS